MPAPILHLTHSELLANDPAVAAPLREAMQREMHCTRLGAIFPDLPFYTEIVQMTVGYWLEWRAESCPVAIQMHSDLPDLFAWHLLSCARTEGLLSRDQRLAILGGFLSHVALDLELHPLVNWCARRDVIRHGGHESFHHRLAEKYHSLFFHIDHDGKDCLGSKRFFNGKSRVLAEQRLFGLHEDLPVVQWAAEVMRFHHPEEPSARQVARWLRTFRRFAFLVSLPLAEWNAQRLDHAGNRKRYYDNECFRFTDFWRRAYHRSVQLLNLAYETLSAEDWSERRTVFLAAANISDLAYPPEHHLPPLPIAQAQDLELAPT